MDDAPDERTAPEIVALAGGVGGAKLAHGLQMALPAGALTVVVNTGDDCRLWGLHISPDIDTVLYTLAGIANPDTGWGIAGDTWNTHEMLQRYGRDTWFSLGDRDLATHILRTQMLEEGRTLTEATANLAGALGVRSPILPMCDERVETLVQTPDDTLEFQDYFVRHRHSDHVTGFTFRGMSSAEPTPQVLAALERASAVILCPSNPFVSIGPIFAVPGMRDALDALGVPVVAVSPIVGGTAIKGPAADMLRSLGHEVSATGVARLYQGVVDGMVIDKVDDGQAQCICDLGMEVLVTQTLMRSERDRTALAEDVLGFCETLSARKNGQAGSGT